MKVLVTGGTGSVGRFVVEELLAGGDRVTVASRTPPPEGFFSGITGFRRFTLDPETMRTPLFEDCDTLVHAAFHHVPGRYRGGEGDDPAEFLRLNRDGSIALFEAARTAGIRRCVFLSSRAVYGRQPPGAVLTEATAPHPDTLYGEAKLKAEQALAALASPSFATASLRATGVYGAAAPGGRHKWEALFADWLAGRRIEPRCGTEVHGADLARAIRLVLEMADLSHGEVFNVSDILVDRHDLLALVAEEAQHAAPPLPAAADATRYNVMDSGKLVEHGWRPGGRRLFERTIRALAREALAKPPVAAGRPAD